ncbi:MAG: hypothetical protein ACREHG_05860 [Candidatus Saccharimonadales bacterium]
MSDRVIALTDVVGYSNPIRTHHHRTHIREQLNRCLRNRFGSDHDVWYEGRGDGMLIVFPEGAEFWAVTQAFENSIAHELYRYNAHVANGAKISLRAAVDMGYVEMDSMGYNGDCMIRAGRMVDSKALKAAMAAGAATVGIIVPSELSIQYSLNYENFRTQVKGMSMHVGMSLI